MEVKLLRVLMFIKFLFLLSIVVHAEEENSTRFKIQPIITDPLQTAIFKIQSNADYLRKFFVRYREEYIEFIKFIQTKNKSDRKIIIIELIEEIVRSIQESSTLINNTRSNINNGTFPKSDGITTALFTILENVSLFGDLIFHFPDMVAKIVRLEKKWIEILLLSAQYTDSYEGIVDESSNAVISSAIKELNEIKEKSEKENNLSNKKKSKRSLSKYMKLDL
ncbi:coiled-coil domain-containing protein 134-like isoform X1 [Vespa velutina]|uniref:coiled-coil domain-containing protein 134-like isoform X1 n=1 Tax=Vespa velutina TaxID=202808 RepID=UPI001FB51477|nr:coiled-coil domain-containing protein 134-like isoform X1 [Vespa velutina]